MQEQIDSKIDQMGSRIDMLEQSITEFAANLSNVEVSAGRQSPAGQNLLNNADSGQIRSSLDGSLKPQVDEMDTTDKQSDSESSSDVQQV